jgi:hypothetical protein
MLQEKTISQKEPPMSEGLDVRESPSGKAIEAYCHTRAQQLGLILGYVGVESVLVQPTGEEQYVVHMSITKRPEGLARQQLCCGPQREA